MSYPGPMLEEEREEQPLGWGGDCLKALPLQGPPPVFHLQAPSPHEHRLHSQSTLGLRAREAEKFSTVWGRTGKDIQEMESKLYNKNKEIVLSPRKQPSSPQGLPLVFFTFEFTCWLKIHLI